MTTTQKYSLLQISLHWAIAGLILVNYLVSESMADVFDGSLEGKPIEGWTPVIHVYVGLAVLGLVAIRLVVRLTAGVPEAQDSGHALLDRAGVWGHRLLYVLMLLVPLLGAITWFGGIDQTADLHVLAMNTMMIVVLIHAAAALLHQFVLRDGLLMRMISPR